MHLQTHVYEHGNLGVESLVETIILQCHHHHLMTRLGPATIMSSASGIDESYMYMHGYIHVHNNKFSLTHKHTPTHPHSHASRTVECVYMFCIGFMETLFVSNQSAWPYSQALWSFQRMHWISEPEDEATREGTSSKNFKCCHSKLTETLDSYSQAYVVYTALTILK